MSFDERLRRQLNDQAAQVSIESTDPSGPAARAARRQTRRRVGVAAVFIAVIGLSAAWITSQDGDEPGVATEPDPNVAETDTADDAPEESTGDDATSNDEPAPASPLTFTNIDAAGAPGGYNLYTSGASNDLYYVLSTAPGLEPEDLDGFWRNDTLYTWTGDGWSTSTFTDRFVSTINADGGLLYTVSTGSNAGDGPAVGTSADGGTTWEWTPLAMPSAFGAPGSYALLDAAGPAGHLVVAWSAPFADWDEAIVLAQEAGLDIGWETHHILSIDGESIRYAPNDGVECANEYWSALEAAAPFPSDLADQIWDGDEPTEEELDRFNAAQAEHEVARAAAHDDVIASIASLDGCARFAECQSLQVDWDRQQAELANQLYLDLGVITDGQTTYDIDWEALDDTTLEAIDEAFADLYQYERSPVVTNGCEEVLYGPGYDPDTAESVTWESLGVTTPESWSGAIAAFLVENGETREIDVPFEPGFVQGVTATEDGFVVDIVNQQETYPEFEEEYAPSTTRWTGGADGWEPTTVFDNLWAAATTPDGTTYTNIWGEGGQVGVRRTTGQSTTTLTMADLFGADAPGDSVSAFIDAGEYGVAVASLDYEAERSVVAFSIDGVNWATSDFDGYWIDGLIVGADGVMVFAHPFGTTGNTEVFVGRT